MTLTLAILVPLAIAALAWVIIVGLSWALTYTAECIERFDR